MAGLALPDSVGTGWLELPALAGLRFVSSTEASPKRQLGQFPAGPSNARLAPQVGQGLAVDTNGSALYALLTGKQLEISPTPLELTDELPASGSATPPPPPSD